MATYQAIAAVSAAIRGLLENSVTLEIAGAEVKLVNADILQSPMADGVGIFLYRISTDPTIHRPGPPGPPIRPVLAENLHYLVTAWSPDPVRQQVLLGWALRVIEDSPLLSASLLNQHGPAPNIFSPGDSVELAAEALSIQDESEIWHAAKAWQQPSISYVARGVRIEPLVP